jgi:hypothetical protein
MFSMLTASRTDNQHSEPSGCDSDAKIDLWQQRAILGLGTTHACKNLFPEEAYVSVGFKADLSVFLSALKCELSDLLREEYLQFVARDRA